MLAVGALAGGVVASLLGTAAAFVVDSATFALSALLISRIRVQHDVLPTDQSGPVLDRTFREGLRYLAARPAVAATLLVKAGLSMGSVDAVVIVYGTVLFALGENGTISMSVLWSAFGIGAIVGPLLTNRLNDGSVRLMRRLVIVGYVCVTLGWLLFGSAPTLLIAALALVVRAMGGSINWTYSSVIIQKSVPDAFLGRMFALDMAAFHLAVTLGIFVTGWAIDQVGDVNVRLVVTALGFISVLPLVLWSLAVLRMERRGAKPLPVGD
jgi:predicted MFS family arabinose efflux permease